ncbi:membrane protein DedA with SNARE-associated domain [Nakamurella sp. UYEF19]|uniref:DedA family protein n=1 Tax=Nakamurella sp. UYEF19 TaxID=1756392 RepID=UPI003391A3BF
MVEYLTLALLVICDAILPVVPSEVTTAGAGAFAASGRLDLTVVWLCVVGGAVAGDFLVYGVGRLLGARAFRWFAGRPSSAGMAARVEQVLRKRAMLKLIALRFLPGGRTMGALITGSLRFPLRRFVGVSMLGAVAWSTWMVGIGYLAGGLVGQPIVASLVAIAVVFLASGIPIARRLVVSPARVRRVPAPPATTKALTRI